MKQAPVWTSVAIVLGLATMLAGPPLVAQLLPTSAVWTDADAEAYTRAATDLHGAAAGHSHAHGAGENHRHAPVSPDDPGLIAAEEAFRTQQARRDGASARRGWLAWGVRMLGVLVAGAGVAGYLAAKR
ncbi:MAG: hypothetical protein WD872_16865 [Pirellulaceae bacterium]